MAKKRNAKGRFVKSGSSSAPRSTKKSRKHGRRRHGFGGMGELGRAVAIGIGVALYEEVDALVANYFPSLSDKLGDFAPAAVGYGAKVAMNKFAPNSVKKYANDVFVAGVVVSAMKMKSRYAPGIIAGKLGTGSGQRAALPTAPTQQYITTADGRRIAVDSGAMAGLGRLGLMAAMPRFGSGRGGFSFKN